MAKKKQRRAAAGKVDLPLAIAKLAEAVQLLSDAHSSGVQSSERVTTINELCDEATELAGVKDDESDATIDDSSGGSSSPGGE
jgi:hypothetical protein